MSLEKQEGMGYLELDKLSFLCRDVGVLSKPSRSVSSSVDGVSWSWSLKGTASFRLPAH